jgi:hypothetical protein
MLIIEVKQQNPFFFSRSSLLQRHANNDPHLDARRVHHLKSKNNQQSSFVAEIQNELRLLTMRTRWPMATAGRLDLNIALTAPAPP